MARFWALRYASPKPRHSRRGLTQVLCPQLRKICVCSRRKREIQSFRTKSSQPIDRFGFFQYAQHGAVAAVPSFGHSVLEFPHGQQGRGNGSSQIIALARAAALLATTLLTSALNSGWAARSHRPGFGNRRAPVGSTAPPAAA